MRYEMREILKHETTEMRPDREMPARPRGGDTFWARALFLFFAAPRRCAPLAIYVRVSCLQWCYPPSLIWILWGSSLGSTTCAFCLRVRA